MKKQLKILIEGRVQGVFFRAFTRKMAEGLSLNGYVKNLDKGHVEIVAEGEEQSLQKLLDWSYRGSILAKVESLSYWWGEMSGKWIKFNVEREGRNFVEDKAKALMNLSKNIIWNEQLPKHVVIIPDGNRRWAKEHDVLPWQGHQEGFKRTGDLSKTLRDMGVKYFTIWGFSTENWNRNRKEVDKLMWIFEKSLKPFREESMKKKIRFRHLGRKDRLPKELIEKMAKLEEDTKNFTEYNFSIALDYGGRDELLRAFDKLKKSGNEITEENISKYLDTNGLPDPDLIIRTGGEQRYSGIMPWQGVYSEFYFCPLYFPDFTPEELTLVMGDFCSRHRRYGK